MSRIEVVRHVAADPAGVALLLSGPAGRDLWPDEEAHFGPPMRSGVGFAVDLTVDEAGRHARGRVDITAAAAGPGATDLRLVLSSNTGLSRLSLDARRFLSRLADAAQARSSAA
ncbi:MAG: hypothetical protein QOF18_867 [Frankiaceae bacterium]|jgi:hypothetical protein|nr:hypothetical protein [Frankiaceae bacterium]